MIWQPGLFCDSMKIHHNLIMFALIYVCSKLLHCGHICFPFTTSFLAYFQYEGSLRIIQSRFYFLSIDLILQHKLAVIMGPLKRVYIF